MRIRRTCAFLVAVAATCLLSRDVTRATLSTKFDAYVHPGCFDLSIDIPLTAGGYDLRQDRQFFACNDPTVKCVGNIPGAQALSATHPGLLWIVGDEFPGHCLNDDVEPTPDRDTCPVVTAAIFSDWYWQFTQAILSVDPTARFAPGGVSINEIQAMEDFRLDYWSKHGSLPPATEWRFHGGDLSTWSSVQAAAAWSAARGAPMTWVFGFEGRDNNLNLSSELSSLLTLASNDARIGHVSYWSYNIPSSTPNHNLFNAGSLTAVGNVFKSVSLGSPSLSRNSVQEIGDFNNDGKADIAIHTPSLGYFAIYLNNGGNTFQTSAWGAGYVQIGAAWDVIVADFTGDGWADFADLHVPSGQIWVHRNLQTGAFETTPWLFADMGDGSDYEVMAADINGDGAADIVERQLSTGLIYFTPVIASGTPYADTANKQLVARSKNGADWRIMLGDFNGDGKAEYADQHVPSGQFWIHPSTSTPNFPIMPNFHMDAIARGGGQAAAGGSWRTFVADFSGDGFADYVDLWTATGEFWIHNNQQNGTFVAAPGHSGTWQIFADPILILGSR